MCALNGLKENIRDVRRFGYSRFEVKVRILVLQASVWITALASFSGTEIKIPKLTPQQRGRVEQLDTVLIEILVLTSVVR